MRHLLFCLALLGCSVIFGGGGERAVVLAAEPSTGSSVTRGDSYERALRSAEKELEDFEKGNGDSGGWGFSAVASLVALLLAIGLMFWTSRWTRRLSFFKAGEKEMRLLDRMAIGKHSTLLLVRVRGRDFWLAEHGGGVTRLADWPADGNDDLVLQKAQNSE